MLDALNERLGLIRSALEATRRDSSDKAELAKMRSALADAMRAGQDKEVSQLKARISKLKARLKIEADV